MRLFTARVFRNLFKFSLLKPWYFVVHKYFFKPSFLFKNLTVVYYYRESIKLNLHLDDWIQQQIFFLGDYEKREIDFLYKFLKPGDTFVDIGANIGLFSLNASRIVDKSGQVIAFEAFMPNFRLLQDNISLNGFQNIVSENIAITDRETKIKIHYNPKCNNIGMASAYLKTFSSTMEVPTTSLDHYVQRHGIKKIDLVKIDIEGGEYLALQGMRLTLSNLRPVILMEINEVTLMNSQHTAKKLIDVLEKLNYKKTMIFNNSQQSYNAVFEYED